MNEMCIASQQSYTNAQANLTHAEVKMVEAQIYHSLQKCFKRFYLTFTGVEPAPTSHVQPGTHYSTVLSSTNANSAAFNISTSQYYNSGLSENELFDSIYWKSIYSQ